MTIRRSDTSSPRYERNAGLDLEMGNFCEGAKAPSEDAFSRLSSPSCPSKGRSFPVLQPAAAHKPIYVENGLAHVAKSSVYGLIIGATAIAGAIAGAVMIGATRHPKVSEALHANPLGALAALEVLGCGLGALGGGIIGAAQALRSAPRASTRASRRRRAELARLLKQMDGL